MRPFITNLVRGALIAAGLSGAQASAQITMVPGSFGEAFSKVPFVSPANFSASLLAQQQKDAAIKKFCAEVNKHFRRYRWPEDACGKVKWQVDLKSPGGSPLVYTEFGNGTETTLMLGGVHPEELTPVQIAFRMARHLTENPTVLNANVHVIIAPLVNPDGFLREVPTRTNGNGVDLNRNFFTLDWYNNAQKLWRERRQKVLAHFPGYFPNSEIETIFQIHLIDRFHPDKILSIHAPLGFLDYDGPGDGQIEMTPTELRAKRLVKAISEKSKNYKVVDYTFYPGSLGNYAGNERHIPTVTLELETTEPSKVETYWTQFLPGMMQSIHYPFSSVPALESKEGDNASPFSSIYTSEQDKTI